MVDGTVGDVSADLPNGPPFPSGTKRISRVVGAVPTTSKNVMVDIEIRTKVPVEFAGLVGRITLAGSATPPKKAV